MLYKVGRRSSFIHHPNIGLRRAELHPVHHQRGPLPEGISAPREKRGGDEGVGQPDGEVDRRYILKFIV